MSNQNYVNHYVEVLTNTMTDAVIRNVSLQANLKLTEEIIKDKESVIKDLQIRVETASNQESQLVNNLKEEIIGHHNTIKALNEKISSLHGMSQENERLKSQANHVDTFRNELIRAREETNSVRQELEKVKTNYEKQIQDLNEKIAFLQLTPAKRKKIEDANKKTTGIEEVTNIIEASLSENTKDGGSF